MNMVDGSTLSTTIFVLVDDWYQQKGCVDYGWCTSRKMKRLGIDVLTFEQHPVA